MDRINPLAAVWALVCALAISACTSTVSYLPEATCQSPVGPTMARIILRRPQLVVGRGSIITISDSGQAIGEVGVGRQLCWDRPPGPSEILAVVPKGVTSLLVNTEAGRTYFVRVHILPFELIREESE